MKATESDKVQHYFDRAAASFDALYAEESAGPVMRFVNRTWRRDIYERFLLTLEHVRRNALVSVLDVGCGSGRYARALVELGVRHVTGVDVAPGMIDLAKRQVADLVAAGASVELVVSDFDGFRTDRKFDAVIAMGFFDYVADPVPVLRKMRERATHSVVASFPSISWYRTPIRKVRYALKRCPVHFYTPEDIRLLSLAAGFKQQETVKIEGAGMDLFSVFLV